MKVFKTKRDDTSSVLSFLASNIEYLPPDIVSLTPLRTDSDPFNTAYTQTKLDENVFREDFYFKRLFIQGEEGCGKSAFVQKIINDWVHSHEKAEVHGITSLNSYELVLASFGLIIPISLGQVSDESHLEQIFAKHVFGKDCPFDSKECMRIITENQANILLLLDGYDEYSDASSALDDLFKAIILPDVTIILTSRQWKLQIPKVKDSYDKLIEIKGFNEEVTRVFIEKFFSSKEQHESEIAMNVNAVLKCLEKAGSESSKTNPLLILFTCIVWLETSLVPQNTADLYKELIKCLFDMYEREKFEFASHGKLKDNLNFDLSQGDKSKSKLSFQTLLLITGKIAFRCLLSRKQCPMRVPSHWFDQEMYRDYLVLALEIGLLQEHKIISKQKEHIVAAFGHKCVEEYLAAYYLCNVNDPAVIFHEQAAIIELLNTGKIEKAFVYKCLDILVHVSGINPVIACELLTILVPEMESDQIVLEKIYACAEKMSVTEGLSLPLRCLRFDTNVSDNLLKLCSSSLEYLSFVNCDQQKSTELASDKDVDHIVTIDVQRNQNLFTQQENLQNLKFLKLDHVNLNNTKLSLHKLPYLQEIVVRAIQPAGKGIVDVLTNVKSPLLKEFTIDYCDCHDAIICFPSIPTLSTLTLSNLKLSPLGWKSLLSSMKNLPALCHLTLSKSNIYGESLEFPKLRKLSKLELESLEFESDDCCKELVVSIRNMTSIESIEITATGITRHIANLTVLPYLKRLNLNDMIFRSEISFVGRKSKLIVLELNRLALRENCGQAFLSAIGCLQNLTTLKISCCNFENENINFFKLRSVKHISLFMNRMTSNCWCVSIFSIGQLEELQTLEVTFAEDEGTNVLALIEDMVDQRSPVPKIVSVTKLGLNKSVTVDFTKKEPLMHNGSCCLQ